MTLALDKPTEPRVKRWTKREYNELVDLGALRRQRVYLFRGELIEMPPMGAPHAQCLVKVTDWLYSTFRPEYRVRIRMPFETAGESMPEPDAAVVTSEASNRLPHPNVAIFVIEVGDTSIELDRKKASEYAAAGVLEYWIVDLNARQIEVCRQPVQDPTTAFGYRYTVRQRATAMEILSPLANSLTKIKVADLLP